MELCLSLAMTWLCAGVKVMFHAYHRGEDAGATSLAKQLVNCQSLIQSELYRLGLNRRLSSNPPRAAFLRIAVDVAYGERPPLAQNLVLEITFVEDLIALNPNIHVYQNEHYRKLLVSKSPIYRALCFCGDAAIPGLVKCLRNDQRSTRLIYHESPLFNRKILPVHVVAKLLLDEITGPKVTVGAANY